MKTMANIKRCNIGAAEQHNTREKNYIAAVNASPKKRYSIFEDRTASNISWVNPDYSGKSLQEIFENQKKLYTAKTGQQPQLKDRIRVNKKTGKEYTVSGWSPIREAVVLVKDDTKIEDFNPFKDWLQEKGVKVVRIDIHRDEGHTDEETGERKYNLHAHLILDYQNPETGKTAKLSDDDMPEMQTKIAEALGMERGESKELTGAEHLTPDDFRAKKAAEKAAELEAKVEALQTEIQDTAKMVTGARNAAIETLKFVCENLKHTGENTVKNFDYLCKSDAAAPKPIEVERRDKLAEEIAMPTPNELKGLHTREASLRNLIWHTTKAIERIGGELQKLARNVPLLPWRKLAREKALQAEIEEVNKKAANTMAEAEKAVKEANLAKETAIELVQEREDAAENREKAVKEREKKFEDEKKTAADASYKTGFADGKNNAAGELKEAKDKLAAKEEELENAQFWSNFFCKTSPMYCENWRELCNQMKEEGLTTTQAQALFRGEVVQKDFTIKRNYKSFTFTVDIELEKSTDGKMCLWYNEKTRAKCMDDLDTRALQMSKGQGLHQ